MVSRAVKISPLVMVISLLSGFPVTAEELPEFPADQVEFFEGEVVDILEANCLRCHAGESPKGELDLTSRESILKGGESGAAVDLLDHENSPLMMAINYDVYEMPPTGQMSPKQIEVLTKWIKLGLPWPKDLHRIEFEAEPGPPQVNEETKQFWSFQKVSKPSVPDTGHANPIDAFVSAKLSDAGLKPSPPAKASELVRRMHYDLLGLPPAPEDVAAWSSRMTDSGGALKQPVVAEYINHLLASPHYGEHWGRHWLDLVRYAETNSYERDGAKPHVWRYRDYVIRSFNDDKPYDQFVQEQLAGDEFAEPTADSLVATGYYRLGRWDDEPADPLLAFYDEIDDIVTTTSQTFLGLTVNCARCHDHKIDPIPQRDYYRMVAFFRNIRRFGVRSHESVLDASVDYIDRPREKADFDAALNRYNKTLKDLLTRIEKIEKRIWDDLEEVEKEEIKHDMNKVPIVQKRNGTLLEDRQVRVYSNNVRRLQELRAQKPKDLASALVVKEDVRSQQPTYILTRGNPHAQAEEVTPGFPSVLSPPQAVIPDMPPESGSSGRRTALAEWITSPDNPLAARVMANRIWQYHFGRGIVRSSSDFGFQGTKPTHPKLLDWLATKFVESGWSIKDMHRQIMTSKTYQQSSRPNPDSYAVDPVNDLLWRFDMRRLSAEEIRDSILWANGSLNAGKMFGPSIYTDIPEAVKAGQSRPGSGWGNSSPEDKVRRSVYIHVKRSLLDPLLESFDFADTDQTCPVRFVTTQPTQALGLMNSEFALNQAQIFADYLKEHSSDLKEQVNTAILRVTQRPATDEEVQQGLDLIAKLKTDHELSADAALKYFCLVALNMNEFMYVD